MRSTVFLTAILIAGCGASAGPSTSSPKGPGPVTDEDRQPDRVDSVTGATDYAPAPDPDQDKDEIPDALDQCPTEPETYNGVEDEDGCPDFTNVFVHVCPTIDVPEVLTYEAGDPPVPDDWKPSLDLVAQVIIDNPQILKVQIAAHTDQQGSSGYNLKLSKERADAVVAYLVGKGVPPTVLSAAGYGETCPMNQGATTGAFTTNRRVELRLLETTSGCTDVPFTCQDAIDQGLVPADDLKYLPESEYCKAK